MGAAFLAGLGCGIWRSFEDISQISGSCKEFLPAMKSTKRKALREGWNKAVKRSLAWEE